MLVSVIALFGLASLAVAVPAAQATYCYEDNLLRAFQHTSAAACSYCATTTANGGYPTFLAATTYAPSRFSSACSCFFRIPTETPPPSCNPTQYVYTAAGDTYGTAIHVLITIDRTQTCTLTTTGATGYKVSNICGIFAGWPVAPFPLAAPYYGGDQCFSPGSLIPVDSPGLEFNSDHYGGAGHIEARNGKIYVGAEQSGDDSNTGTFVAQGCGSCVACPSYYNNF